MGKKLNTDQALLSTLPDLVFLAALPLVFSHQSGVGNEERICILPPSKSFFSSDQLPLTGVNDSSTKMRCSAQ